MTVECVPGEGEDKKRHHVLAELQVWLERGTMISKVRSVISSISIT